MPIDLLPTNDLSLEFEPNDIFPLPVSAFEEYFVDDDRYNLSTTEISGWFFTGSVDEALFAEAFRRTVAVEPLLFAVVEKVKGRLCWTVPKTPFAPTLEIERLSQPVLETGEEERTFSLPEGWDGDVPRFRLTIGTDGFLLTIGVKHFLTDGTGFVRFVARWAATYRALNGNSGVDVESLPEPMLVKEREDLHLNLPEKTSLWTDLRYIVSETFLWFCRRPWSLTPLLRRSKRRSNDLSTNASSVIRETTPLIYWKTVPPEIFARYIRRAKALDVSVNSIMTRDVFVALNRWRATYERRERKRRVRMLIPTNLRAPEHRRTPLVNLIGYAFLDRFSTECDRSESFVCEIDEQMREIIRWSVGAFFLDGLKFFRAIPGALRLLTSSVFCHSTLVFSNLGRVDRISDQSSFRESGEIFFDEQSRLVRVVSGPPPRPNTSITVAAIGTKQETVLSFVFDPALVSPSVRTEFVNFVWEELLRTADEAETNDA